MSAHDDEVDSVAGRVLQYRSRRRDTAQLGATKLREVLPVRGGRAHQL